MADNTLPETRFAFTQAKLAALPTLDKAYIVRDTKTPGLRCRVRASGTKTLEVCKRPAGSGKPVTVRICKVGELPLDGRENSVRAKATEAIGKLLAGKSPNDEKRARAKKDDALGYTLRQALDDYLDESPKLAPATRTGYRRITEKHLGGWLKTPLVEITPKMVRERHAQVSEDHPVAANNAYRVLKVLYRFAMEKFEDEKGVSRLPAPPTRKMKKDDLNPENARRDCVSPHELEAWFAAVLRLPEDLKRGDGALASAYLRFVILTGLRRREASGLTWGNVDMSARKITVTNTKNRSDHVLPMSDYLMEILAERRQATGGKGRVFPIEETRRFVGRVREWSGVNVTVHGLRRSFATYCNNLKLGIYTTKTLLNHQSGGDVTRDYTRVELEDLREPMQDITDFVLGHAGLREDNVVELRDRRGMH